MLGMAQKLYLAKGEKLPGTFQQPRWPNVFQCLPYIDYAMAQQHLSDYPEIDESIAALIGYLSLAAREGHICISIDKAIITPSPEQLCENDLGSKLSNLILKGIENLPKYLFTDVSQSNVTECPLTPICKYGPLYYLQRYWRQETAIIKTYHALADSVPSIVLDMAIVEKSLMRMLEEKKLLPEQATAIRKACQGTISLICGGPGTGKTYTAGELIKIYWAAIDERQRKKCQIALAAPTGKAAANLQKSLHRAISSVPEFPDIQSQTLHSLLGIRRSNSNQEPLRLSADLILIDESSMIDVHLMQRLLMAIKPGARLILLGDHHQLPPVAAGMPFADLMSKSDNHCTLLKTCLRSELQGIVDFADAVNKGDSSSMLRAISGDIPGIGRVHITPSNVTTRQKAIVDYASPFFLENQDHDPYHVLESFCRFRILCPLRQGPFGIDFLNNLFIQRVMHEMRNREWFMAPILIISNDNNLTLSNGDVGVLVRRMPKNRKDFVVQEGDYALFQSKNEDSIRKLPALLLPRFEYAFCLSVHKSQGSEFDRVLLLMPEGSERFGREVLYTAVTRARKQLDICGTNEVLVATIANQAHRLSGISMRITVEERLKKN